MQPKTNLKQKEIEDILDRCDACYLGMVEEGGIPYVLPFNFGY